MGIHIPLSKGQRPCATCGKDAFTERQPGNWMAGVCGRCNQTICQSCSVTVQVQEQVSTNACPTCKEALSPIRLDPSLLPDSVWLMPPQTLAGWPDLTVAVYHGMIDRVARYLPLILESLKGAIPEQALPAVEKRLCFALATGKYMEWCYNRRDEVRLFMHNQRREDFPAPDLAAMARLIEDVIAKSRNP
jgi:hypothetical protein